MQWQCWKFDILCCHSWFDTHVLIKYNTCCKYWCFVTFRMLSSFSWILRLASSAFCLQLVMKQRFSKLWSIEPIAKWFTDWFRPFDTHSESLVQNKLFAKLLNLCEMLRKHPSSPATMLHSTIDYILNDVICVVPEQICYNYILMLFKLSLWYNMAKMKSQTQYQCSFHLASLFSTSFVLINA